MSERRNLKIGDKVGTGLHCSRSLKIDWGEVFFGWGGRMILLAAFVGVGTSLALPAPWQWKGPSLADTRFYENPPRANPYEYKAGTRTYLTDPFGNRIWVYARGEVGRASDLPSDPIDGDMWRIASLGGYFIWEQSRGQWVDP